MLLLLIHLLLILLNRLFQTYLLPCWWLILRPLRLIAMFFLKIRGPALAQRAHDQLVVGLQVVTSNADNAATADLTQKSVAQTVLV